MAYLASSTILPRPRALAACTIDASDLSYPKVRGRLRGVTQKRRLTHARLATDREHSTVPAAHLVEHLVYRARSLERPRNPG